ncbi:MAG: hypothetical protein GX418_09460 [Clostridiales bacterium]|nr:hypothetical protein [Clostridiales bacterium]
MNDNRFDPMNTPAGAQNRPGDTPETRLNPENAPQARFFRENGGAAGKQPVSGAGHGQTPDGATRVAPGAAPGEGAQAGARNADAPAITPGAGAQAATAAAGVAEPMPEPTAAQTDGQPPAQPSETPPPTDGAFSETLLKAVEERVARAEKSVLRSMAEQNGLDEQALSALLAQARGRRAEAPPDGAAPAQARQRLDEINARLTGRLLAAEVKSVGAEMGLLDPEAAMKLLDTARLLVDETGEVSGVPEALAALRESKAYLFAKPQRAAWAQRIDAGGGAEVSGVEEAFYRKNPGLRR